MDGAALRSEEGWEGVTTARVKKHPTPTLPCAQGRKEGDEASTTISP